MDLVTDLPKSDRGFDAVFTCVDRFSKLVTFVPCMTASSARDIADLFFAHVVTKFGMPQTIVCDRDRRFVSEFW